MIIYTGLVEQAYGSDLFAFKIRQKPVVSNRELDDPWLPKSSKSSNYSLSDFQKQRFLTFFKLYKWYQIAQGITF